LTKLKRSETVNVKIRKQRNTSVKVKIHQETKPDEQAKVKKPESPPDKKPKINQELTGRRRKSTFGLVTRTSLKTNKTTVTEETQITESNLLPKKSKPEQPDYL
jgi:hypothetical protein